MKNLLLSVMALCVIVSGIFLNLIIGNKTLNQLLVSQPDPSELTFDNMLNIDEECYTGCWWGIDISNSRPEDWELLLNNIADVYRNREINEFEFENSVYFAGATENPRREFTLQMFTQNDKISVLHFHYRVRSLGNVLSLAGEGTYGSMRDVFSIIGDPKDISLNWNGNMLTWENIYGDELERIEYQYHPRNIHPNGPITICPAQTPVNFVRIIMVAEGIEYGFNSELEFNKPIEEATDYTVQSWTAELLENPEACISINIE